MPRRPRKTRSRRPRPPKLRRSGTRAQGLSVRPFRVVNARQNPPSPNTFLFLPVNELALGWQRAWVDAATPVLSENYVERYDDLLMLLSENVPGFPEEATEVDAVAAVRQIGSAAEGTELGLAIEAVKDDLGALEEYEATLLGGAKPNWGILGSSLTDKGFSLVTFFGRGKGKRPISKTTLQLERDVLFSNTQVRGKDAKFPVARLGNSPEGYRSYFMCASEVTSDTGYNLAPSIGSVRATQAAAGIIKALLEGDVWTGQQFAKDTTVLFALPGGGDRVSQADQALFIRSVCSFTEKWVAEDGSAFLLGRTGASENFFIQEDGKLYRARKVPARPPYWMIEPAGIQQGAGGGKMTGRAEDGLDVSFPGKPAKTYTLSDENFVYCPDGQDHPYVAPPGVWQWLQAGCEALAKQGVYGSDEMRKVAAAIPSLSFSFYGNIPATDGVPRFLPATISSADGPETPGSTEITYFGSDYLVRRIASLRAGARFQLGPPSLRPGWNTRTGRYQKPLTFAQLFDKAIFGAEGINYSGVTSRVQELAPLLRADTVLSLVKPREKNQFLDGVEGILAGAGPQTKYSTSKKKRYSAEMPMGPDRRNPLIEVVFTIYAALTPEAYEVMSKRGDAVATATRRALEAPSLGVVEEYDYGVFFQESYTPDELAEIVAQGKIEYLETPQDLDEGEEPTPFSARLAIRRDLVRRSGLGTLAEMYEDVEQASNYVQGNPVPFIIVGSMIVDAKKYNRVQHYRQMVGEAEKFPVLEALWLEPPRDTLTATERRYFGERDAPNYPPLREGNKIPGTPGLALLLTEIGLPRPTGASTVPDPEKLDAVSGFEGQGLLVRSASGQMLSPLSREMVQAEVYKKRTGQIEFAPVYRRGSKRPARTLFTMKNLKTLDAWGAAKAEIEAAERAAAKEEERPPRPICGPNGPEGCISERAVYFALLTNAFGGRPRQRGTRATRAGRAGFEARGGVALRSGSGRRTATTRREWAVKLPASFESPFSLAQKIIKGRKRRGISPVARQADLPEVRDMNRAFQGLGGREQSVSQLTSVVDAFEKEFNKHGILVPEFIDDVEEYKADVVEALQALRDAVGVPFSLPADVGLLTEGAEEGDFGASVAASLAMPNGRRPRRRRKARKSRRSRRNPTEGLWDQEEIADAVDYSDQLLRRRRTKSKATGQAAKDLAELESRLGRLFSETGEQVAPTDWPVSQESVLSYFPTQDARWTPEDRLQNMAVFPLVAQVKESEGAPAPGKPWGSDAIARVIGRNALLSLDEAARIIEQQKMSRAPRGSNRRAVQASSALCRMGRSLRLGGYKLPPSLRNKTKRGVLILVSPESTRLDARVMTFRNGTHIDCDMVGPKDQLTKLIGQALQSALYWSVEKGPRFADSSIWVARIGEPEYRIVRRPNTQISVGQAIDNLLNEDNGLNWTNRATTEQQINNDRANYADALEKLEKDRRLRRGRGPAPVAPESSDVGESDETAMTVSEEGDLF